MPDRNPSSIADEVIKIIPRIKNRAALDNTKCIEAMDSANIAERITGLYREALEGRS